MPGEVAYGRNGACRPRLASIIGPHVAASPRSDRPSKGTHIDEARTHHWHHGSGRLVSCGAVVAEGVRGSWTDPSGLDVQHRADRSPVRRSPCPGGEAVPPLRRPVGRGPAGDAVDRGEAGRGVQPGGAVARAGLLRRARAHRRHDGHRNHPDAGGGAAGRDRDALLPGLVLGALRVDSAAAERGDAVPPALAVRRREALQLLDHQELPRGLRHVRGQRDPVQPRVSAARRDVRDPQDHSGGGGDQGRPAGLSLPGQPGRGA